jgi:potassium-transporting ATPase KdpC subunit
MRVVRAALSLLIAMTLILGVAYPVVVTGLARLGFPRQAQGSLVYRGGTLIGSSLIGQSFSDPGHFWSRPSATTPQPYNGLASTGSNLGPLNPALLEHVKNYAKALHDADPENTTPIPVDLVTASASGLDPEISLAAAQYQAGRVARARAIALDDVHKLIDSHTKGRLLGLIGEPRVNVLELNLALDSRR